MTKPKKYTAAWYWKAANEINNHRRAIIAVRMAIRQEILDRPNTFKRNKNL